LVLLQQLKIRTLIHPVIHIVEKEIEVINTPNAYLLVQVADGFIGFVSFHPTEKKVNGWVLYKVEQNLSVSSLQDMLSEIAAAETWVHNNYHKILIVQQNCRNIIMPVSLSKEEGKEALFNLMFAKQKNELHLKDIVLQQNIVNHFAVDSMIADVMNKKFPKAEWWHVQSLLLSKEALSETIITATIWLNEIHLTVEKNSQWLLLQTYSYQTPEDALYIILNAMKQLNITQEECKVLLQGMIDQRSPLFDMLQLYILNLQFNNHLDYQFPANDQHPVHLYSSLDQILSCVS
jgi:Protein of unknown function (DUF3822)